MKLVHSWLRDLVPVPDAADGVAVRLGLRGFEVASVAHGREPVIDFEITANRPDCLSVIGLAREASAAYGLPLELPERAMPPAGQPQPIEVAVEDAELCPRYCAQVFEVRSTTPAPAWMRDRLEAAGVRTISAVVDVTNYVMLEMGQPTHAFDYAKLSGRALRIRRAKPGEMLRTLDGVDRALQPDMLVIADAERAQAIGGVMGGALSEIGPATKLLVLESAYFNPASVRRTSKRLGLKTEASTRFERGADVNAAPAAIARAAALLQQIGAAQPLGPMIDKYPSPRPAVTLTLRAPRIERLLGMRVPDADVPARLEPLGFVVEQVRGPRPEVRGPGAEARGSGSEVRGPGSEVRGPGSEVRGPGSEVRGPRPEVRGPTSEARGAGAEARGPGADDARPTWLVTVPSFRVDVQREIDLIEEIARHDGYAGLPATFPALRAPQPPPDPRTLRDRLIRQVLTACGLSEAMTFAFIEASAAAPFADTAAIVTVANPLSEKYAVLRPSMLPGLVDAVAHNRRREQDAVRLFETGTRFTSTGETRAVAGVWCGADAAPHWSGATRAADFYTVKGIVDALARALRVDVDFEPAAIPWLVDGRAAAVYVRLQPDLEPPTSDLRPRTSDLGSRTSDLGPRTSDLGSPTPDLGPRTSDLGSPTSNLGPRTSDLGSPTSDLGPRTSDLRQKIGVVGQLSPRLLDARGLASGDEVYAFELDIDALAAAQGEDELRAESLPRFPSVVRDLSVLIDSTLPAAAVRGTIRSSAPSTLARVIEFDRYRGKGVPEGRVSLSLRLTFRSPGRTLTDAEVDEAMERIVSGLSGAHGAVRR